MSEHELKIKAVLDTSQLNSQFNNLNQGRSGGFQSSGGNGLQNTSNVAGIIGLDRLRDGFNKVHIATGKVGSSINNLNRSISGIQVSFQNINNAVLRFLKGMDVVNTQLTLILRRMTGMKSQQIAGATGMLVTASAKHGYDYTRLIFNNGGFEYVPFSFGDSPSNNASGGISRIPLGNTARNPTRMVNVGNSLFGGVGSKRLFGMIGGAYALGGITSSLESLYRTEGRDETADSVAAFSSGFSKIGAGAIGGSFLGPYGALGGAAIGGITFALEQLAKSAEKAKEATQKMSEAIDKLHAAASDARRSLANDQMSDKISTSDRYDLLGIVKKYKGISANLKKDLYAQRTNLINETDPEKMALWQESIKQITQAMADADATWKEAASALKTLDEATEKQIQNDLRRAEVLDQLRESQEQNFEVEKEKIDLWDFRKDMKGRPLSEMRSIYGDLEYNLGFNRESKRDLLDMMDVKRAKYASATSLNEKEDLAREIAVLAKKIELLNASDAKLTSRQNILRELANSFTTTQINPGDFLQGMAHMGMYMSKAEAKMMNTSPYENQYEQENIDLLKDIRDNTAPLKDGVNVYQ